MSGGFQATYTDAQRDALARAFTERGIRPAARVVALAEAGELEPGLEPFTVAGGPNSVRTFAARLRKRQSGELVSELAKGPPRDAVEALRRRLVHLVESMLTDAERKRKHGTLRPVDIGPIARALRELAAIPGPHEQRTVQPGERTPGDRTRDGKTRTGVAAAMLADPDERVNAASPDSWMRDGIASLEGPPR
jgi:hypothetical protein